MDLRLQGKRALVTGSSAGIGAAIAEALAAEGVSVVLHGRDPDRTKAVAELISKRGGHAEVAVGDLTTDAGSAATVAAVVKTMGGIDILVNNVGAPVGGKKANWFENSVQDYFVDPEGNSWEIAWAAKMPRSKSGELLLNP